MAVQEPALALALALALVLVLARELVLALALELGQEQVSSLHYYLFITDTDMLPRHWHRNDSMRDLRP